MFVEQQKSKSAKWVFNFFRKTPLRCSLIFHQVGNEEGMIAALLQIIAADSIDMYVSDACFTVTMHQLALLDVFPARHAKPARSG